LLLSTRRLDITLVAAILVNLVVFMMFDLRYVLPMVGVPDVVSRQIQVNLFTTPWSKLLRSGVPLGISTFLVALMSSLPRLSLARVTNESTLGVFSILCYVCFPMTLIVSAVMQAATPRMSLAYRADTRSYRRLCYSLFLICTALGILNAIAIAAAGSVAVTWAFGDELVDTRGDLLWVSLAFGVGYLAAVPATALVAQRHFRLAMITCAGSCTVCGVACLVLIPPFGLVGAIWTMTAGSTAHLLLSAVTWWWLNVVDRANA
ncbi:MAG: hypothetical protein KDB23_14825, partial [Planctomycetales bacterium]|nr:hypothetical protein [Planctomycetales bacterium]